MARWRVQVTPSHLRSHFPKSIYGQRVSTDPTKHSLFVEETEEFEDSMLRIDVSEEKVAFIGEDCKGVEWWLIEE